MPSLRFQDDGSIGQALGSLATGISAAFDPKAAAQGAYINQLINASKATEAKTLLDADVTRRTIGAADETANAMVNAYRVNNPAPIFDLPEGAQGPLIPEDARAPIRNQYDANIGMLSSNAKLAALRAASSGSPLDTLRLGPAGLALANVTMGGAPTNEGVARQYQTMLKGELPNASTALTDAGRQALVAEDIQKSNAIEDFKQGVTPVKLSPTEGVIFPQRVGPKFGVQPNAQGQFVVEPRAESNPTELMREYERHRVDAKERGIPAKPFDEWYLEAKRAGAQTQQGAYAQGIGTGNAKTINSAYEQGDLAADQSMTLDQVRNLINEVDTGKTTQMLEGLRRTTGIAIDPNTDKVQQLNAIISQMIPRMRPAGSGSTSDYEERLYASALMGLGNTPGGNQLILDSLQRANALALARGDIARRAKTGELDERSAINALGNLRQSWVQELNRFGITPGMLANAPANGAGAATGGAPAAATPGLAPGVTRYRINPQSGELELVGAQ